MRIISGSLKGKRIIAPKKLPVRPTTDMAKEGLFNILNNHYYFDDISVLDLFSGTGNLSYEFASRGSTDIVAVDANSYCAKFIAKIAENLKFNIEVFKNDVYKYLERTTRSFDVIFADPPYNFEKKDFSKIAELVFDRKLLRENGTLIIEHSSNTDLTELKMFRNKRKYGGSVFSFFTS